MSAELGQRTILPPSESLDDLIQLFATASEAELLAPTGERLVMPRELYEVLRTVVDTMANGQAVTVTPRHPALTTQEAADLLNISRPNLGKLLDRGAIPFHRPGRHRRVLLRDVLKYQDERRHEKRAALDELLEISEEAGLYEATAEPRKTR